MKLGQEHSRGIREGNGDGFDQCLLVQKLSEGAHAIVEAYM